MNVVGWLTCRYIFLNDTLVAPIFDSKNNETSRSVWVPPGDWEDAWDGSIVTGPKTVTTTQPYERIPMWHNKNGGLIVTTDKPGLRIDDADWSTLTLEAFPPRAGTAATTQRLVVPRNGTFADRTELSFSTDVAGLVTLDVAAVTTTTFNDDERAWAVRLHLFPGQRVTSVAVDGVPLSEGETATETEFYHIAPVAAGSSAYFPLGGRGTAPAENAGHVAEFLLPAAALGISRTVVARIE